MIDTSTLLAQTDVIVDAHGALEGPLLPILHALQDSFGCVPEAAQRRIAERLNISRAEVHGVMTFYHDFREEPAGRRVLKLCRGEACQSRGSEALAAHARDRLGVDWHGTTADGRVTLEPVYCLGLCSTGPSALDGDRPVSRLDAERFDKLLAEVR